VPSAAPGSRLPHFDVQLLGSAAGSCSVLDVVSQCGACSLLLLLGPGTAGGGSQWQAAAKQLQQAGLGDGVQLNVLQLLPAGARSSGDGSGSAAPGGGSAQVGAGWCREAVDVEGRWQQLSGVGAGGVLLVRPDGHVAWRMAECSSGASSAEQLAKLLQQAAAQVLPA
jgi:hypothetical protein